MAPLVDIAALTYRYPGAEVAALDAADLALDGGLCLVTGPSGGGKSTLLRLLNGLVPHLYGGTISGRAVVAEQDVLRTPARHMAAAVGFVFQDAERQAVHTTVERDVAFALENAAVPPAEMRRRVATTLEQLGIGHLAGRTIASLSGGERQRVAVAGAVTLRPRLLVLDEPVAQLDAGGAMALIELCLELRATGTAVVIAEHRLDELLARADRLVAVRGGRLDGPAHPVALAASLDSAPQVVRLAAALGWTPPPLDVAGLPAMPSGDRGAAGHAPRPAPGPEAWRLDGVTTGPADLLAGVDAAGFAGEVVAVIGRNGAGKTSLLRAIAGLAPPRRGVAWRRPGRVAYLPQDPAALLHRATVREEVAWTVRRGGGDPARSEHLLTSLRLETVADRDPRDLSSGERQRAAVAVVLCGDPAIALLDEPTRGMDGAARDGLVAAVRALAAGGSAVALATHDSDLAAEVADRVVEVHDGRVTDRGAPELALSGRDNPHATQLGRLFAPPGPVSVAAVAHLVAGERIAISR